MQPLRLCMLLASIAVLKASGPSKKVLGYFSYLSGIYDNKEQTQKPGDDHDFLQVRIIPVDIPCLRPDLVAFVEEAVNGVIRVFILGVVKDGIEDTVTLTMYNFTDYTKYKPGEYNVEKLSNISCGDLQGDKDCIASYRISNERFVFGNFPQCRLTVNGKHPRFIPMHTCDSLTLAVPMYSPQMSPVEPYELPKRQKYPLINPPKDYMDPCDK